MLVTIINGDHCEYPDTCPFHATKPNKMGVCGHRKYSAEGTALICAYLNTPAEHINPSSRCPLVHEPIGGIRVEMRH